MRKGERTLREKTLLTLCQNRESSLSSLEFHCSSRYIPTSSNQSENSPLIQFEIKPTALNFKSELKYIQSHIQLGDIKVRFKIMLHSLLDRKVLWRLNQRSFLLFFHCKESYREFYSHIYKLI